MKVVITGASGFLGRHLVDAAVDAGLHPIGTTRRALPAREGVRWMSADLADIDSLRAAMRGADALVANAALAPGRQGASPAAFEAANLQGTLNQLRAAAAEGIQRVVYVSTVAVYQSRLGVSIGEDGAKIDPESTAFEWKNLTTNPEYSRSKARAEAALWAEVHALDLQITVLRPGPIYGPGDEKLSRRYSRWLDHRAWPVPTARVPHVHGRDVADAAVAALTRPESFGKAYNVTGESVPVLRAVRALRDALGRRTVLVPIPVPMGVRFDDGAASRDLGFVARSVEAGMVDTARWLADS